MPIMPAVLLRQGSNTLYAGFMVAADLVPLMIVDRWYPEEGWDLERQGYQREIYEEHINGIKDFLTKNPDEILPTSIVAIVRTEHNALIRFEGEEVGSLSIQPGCHLYIIDGQHRLIAIDRILTDNPQSDLSQLKLPVVLLTNVDKVEELRQFYLINNRQRRITTNLAFALLATAAASQPKIANTLAEPGKEWLLPATGIAIRLNEDPNNAWTNKIRYPSALDPSSPTRVTPLNALARSLEQFFKNRDGIVISANQLTDYLKSFWEAVGQLMPEAFDRPRGFVVQRTTGVYSLNFVAYEMWRQTPTIRTATSATITQQLRADTNGFIVANWARGGPFATNYRGNARFRELGREIIERLGLDPRRRARTN